MAKEHSACQASLNALYELAVETMEQEQIVGTRREMFDHRLGTSGHLYSVTGWNETLRERDEALAEVERLRAEFIERTAREHCHCDLEPSPCSVCRARAEVVASDDT